MPNKKPSSKSNEIKKDLLSRPLEFRNVIRIESLTSMFGPEKEEVLEDIKQSYFREIVEELTDDEIYAVFLEFEKEVGIIKKWILNSEVRTLTFIELGKLGRATATEIGERINKHPKSVSTYLNEFKKKMWVGEPEQEGREKWYSLTEIGQSYFNLSMNIGWFKGIIRKELYIDETIISIYHSRLYPESYLYKIPFVRDPTEPAHYSEGINYYFIDEGPDVVPPFNDLINKILDIVTTMVKKLNLAITLPDIRPINDDVSISVNSGDEDILALIFAAFNYLEKNKLRTGELWKISRIKIINVNSYFNADMPNIHDDEGFMTNEETETFIKKVLTNFKNKLNHEKVD